MIGHPLDEEGFSHPVIPLQANSPMVLGDDSMMSNVDILADPGSSGFTYPDFDTVHISL